MWTWFRIIIYDIGLELDVLDLRRWLFGRYGPF